MNYKLPKWYEIIFTTVFWPIGFFLLFLKKEWSPETRNTLLLLMLFWPVDIMYANNQKEWGKEQKTAAYFIVVPILLMLVLICCINSLIPIILSSN